MAVYWLFVWVLACMLIYAIGYAFEKRMICDIAIIALLMCAAVEW